MVERDMRAGAIPGAGVQKLRAGRGGLIGGTAEELAKLADLKERGVLSDAEFQQQKARLLG